MERQVMIENTFKKLNQLPDVKILEVNDFIDFLLGKTDDAILTKGIQKMTSTSKSFDFLSNEEDLYTVNDVKEKYK